MFGCLGFSVGIYFSDQATFILLSIVCFGAFGFSMYGLALEMAAECTYPTPEAITTGIMLIGSQLMSVLLILLLQFVAPVISHSTVQVCGSSSIVQVCFFSLVTTPIFVFDLHSDIIQHTLTVMGKSGVL